jgi:hypothetical protein
MIQIKLVGMPVIFLCTRTSFVDVQWFMCCLPKTKSKFSISIACRVCIIGLAKVVLSSSLKIYQHTKYHGPATADYPSARFGMSLYA